MCDSFILLASKDIRSHTVTLVRTLLFILFWQVVDIAKLMKAYISMIVKKRYSTSRSVSSHGSQGSSR